ncbi:uncharacterized protein LOC127285035 [Leptopilina boulardi]|uniref:uncharacterized protein LOC127285035 n=1 Tax=Leptopilina boulardi TaxID=63433 RepID=UPI0021F645D3|nr:uncharacterized protein LOC127285035 [Leptopilina boulardi]
MDTLISRSPLATVQFIPVFHYLNLLSDFLFIEEKLIAEDKNKQIPIVNALYQYLEDHHDNKTMQVKLIRHLLQGSDLYGEEDNEEVDEIFVYAMFEYIISSLVFDKYGNIYGFLAETIRKVVSLKFHYVLKEIKETLENAIFENEYGSTSVLTELAVNRIYTDIILPIFPQPKTNVSILSLDYIFAQAGSMYLRRGRIKNTYYSNIDNNNSRYSQENLFDEYLTIGHIIRNLLDNKKMDPLILRVFALPALFYYIFPEDKVKYESITNLIFDPHHWEMAFHQFQEYVTSVFDQIEDQLKNDYIYKLHLGFSHFQNRYSMAKSIVDSNCNFLSDKLRESKIVDYVQLSVNIKCSPTVVLPNLNDLYKDQIHNLAELYGNYDLEITKQCFKQYLFDDLHDIVINLVVTNNELINGSFNDLQYVSYDLLEFYYNKNETSNYYALIRKNYTVTLIKEDDDPEHFEQQMGPSLYDFKGLPTKITVKFANEGINELCAELMKYKKERFKSYLNFLNFTLKSHEWSKEFGLSLVPFYPSLSTIANYHNNEEYLYEKDNINFLNKFPENITSQITNLNTRHFLSILGTNIKTIFMKGLINKIVVSYNVSEVSPYSEANITFFKQVSLHIEEPKFETISITQRSIELLKLIISYLKEKINYNFTSVSYILRKMNFVQYNFLNAVAKVGENDDKTLFVNALKLYTGYGYKFINIYETVIASLRTDYEIEEKIFITLIADSPENKKTYIKVNNASFEFETNNLIYEINNQLRKRYIRFRFSGIWNHHDNKKCVNDTYLKQRKYSNDCSRHWRFIREINLKERAVELLKNKVIINGTHIATEEQIRHELKNYIFPENDEIFLFYFTSKWKHYKKNEEFDTFEESDWGRSCKIDNPNLFNKLKYDELLENNNITVTEGKYRINSHYTYRERRKIEEGTTIENIIKNFNHQKAGFSVSFEDYYAIRNFMTSGYERITGDTREAKLMKLALYKLSIRESDDLREEFEWTLFRLESKPMDIVNKELFVGNRIIFQKFTLTSLSITSATIFSAHAAYGFINILYEMKFTDTYFRATIKTEVDEIESFTEKKVILLPGYEFEIMSILEMQVEGIGKVLKLVLNIVPESVVGKHEYYKIIMREITKIKL